MNTAARYIEDIRIGDQIPALITTLDRAQLFLFSAATNNAHRIHYDRSWAVDVEGPKDVVIHGPLHGALMARSVTDWMGPAAHLRSYAIRHMRPGFPGDQLRFEGTVVGKRDEKGLHLVDIEVKETNGEGELLGSAEISVAFPSREAAT